MGRYCQFWWICIKWSYWRWEGREPIMTTIASYIVTLGGSLGAYFADRWWLALLPIGLLIIFIAPYRIWESTDNNLQLLIKPRLDVEVELSSKTNLANWKHLIVRNPTGKAIQGCYGLLVDFRCKSPLDLNSELPSIGIRYPWSTRAGCSLGRTTCNIGSNSFDVLDIAACKENDPDHFYTPILSGDQYTRYMEFPLPIGVYELDIIVGSDTIDFQPTKKTFEIKFARAYDLELCDIT